MKRLLATLVVLWGLALAQVDVEVGRESPGFGFSLPSSWYALARYNFPFGPEFLGSRIWLLPEVGLWFSDPIRGYVRLQALLDTPRFTIFVDCRSTGKEEYCRFGVRFSL